MTHVESGEVLSCEGHTEPLHACRAVDEKQVHQNISVWPGSVVACRDTEPDTITPISSRLVFFFQQKRRRFFVVTQGKRGRCNVLKIQLLKQRLNVMTGETLEGFLIGADCIMLMYKLLFIKDARRKTPYFQDDHCVLCLTFVHASLHSHLWCEK